MTVMRLRLTSQAKHDVDRLQARLHELSAELASVSTSPADDARVAQLQASIAAALTQPVVKSAATALPPARQVCMLRSRYRCVCKVQDRVGLASVIE
jgi:hypothetical protein